MPAPKISVVTPTFARERFLPGLYDCFARQAYPHRELLVYDDTPVRSAFFDGLSDGRVRYLHSAARLSIGEKRNHLIEQAQGDVIAFFDDDDYYAPEYLQWMSERLADADLVKLSGWFALSVPDDAFFFWDTAVNHLLHYKVGEGPVAFVLSEQFKGDFVAKNVDGYGFSYVFRRAAADLARFPATSFGEDRAFMVELRRAGGRVVHASDDIGVVVHLLHARNTSVIFPQYRLPPGLAARLFPGLTGYLSAVAGPRL